MWIIGVGRVKPSWWNEDKMSKCKWKWQEKYVEYIKYVENRNGVESREHLFFACSFSSRIDLENLHEPMLLSTSSFRLAGCAWWSLSKMENKEVAGCAM
jgi:hypothetical protein